MTPGPWIAPKWTHSTPDISAAKINPPVALRSEMRSEVDGLEARMRTNFRRLIAVAAAGWILFCGLAVASLLRATAKGADGSAAPVQSSVLMPRTGAPMGGAPIFREVSMCAKCNGAVYDSDTNGACDNCAPDPLQAALDHVTGLMAGLSPTDDKQLVLAKIYGLLQGYHARWKKSDWVPVDVDRYYEAPLWNPDSNQPSRTFKCGMLLDLRAVSSGKNILVDHKTTSSDISDPNGDYWRQLIVEGQLSHYLYLLWLNGIKMDAAVWDVVRKPGISPRQLTAAEKKSIDADRLWFGVTLTKEQAEEALASGRETLSLYAVRVAHESTIIKPDWYFQRRQIPRLDAEIMDYARELWEHGQELVQLRRSGRHVRNSGACILYGGACQYLPLCSGHDDLDSGKWTSRAWVHPELPVGDGDGKDILTNSRIRCYQTCRRKHQLQYELGIERADAEDKEALWFGTVWHQALAIYFKTIQENTNGSSTCAAEPGIDLGCGASEVNDFAQ